MLIVVYVPEGRVAGVRDVACAGTFNDALFSGHKNGTVPLPWPSLGAGSPILPVGGRPRAERTRFNDMPESCEQSSMLTFNVTFKFI